MLPPQIEVGRRPPEEHLLLLLHVEAGACPHLARPLPQRLEGEPQAGEQLLLRGLLELLGVPPPRQSQPVVRDLVGRVAQLPSLGQLPDPPSSLLPSLPATWPGSSTAGPRPAPA